MITETIIDIVFSLFNRILEFIPNYDWSINSEFIETALGMVQLACYMLPMTTAVIPMISIIAILILWRIVISLFKTIWEVLPLV